MPTVTQERIRGWAHCENPLCAGNVQQPADVVRTTTNISYRELGGDANGFEKSFDHFAFVDEDDKPCQSPCPACGKPRAAAAQERPVYPTSQYDQKGLLRLIQDGMVKSMSDAATARDTKITDLETRLAEQSAQLAEMRELLEAKRGPGRPRKLVDEPADTEA